MKLLQLHQRSFMLLLVLTTLGFAAVLWAFASALFWSVVLAILFAPLHRRILARMPGHANAAALSTLGLCLLVAIFPLVLIGASMVSEAAAVYARVNSGHLDFGTYVRQVMDALPPWLQQGLEQMQLGSFAQWQTRLSQLALQASQLAATQAVGIGQDTLGFAVGFCVMLYLLFFLLRDGRDLAERVHAALPLQEAHKTELMAKFTTVIRATVKGNLAVAASQGALGGVIFAVLGIQAPVLWGVVMAVLSLLPAVGASLIWGPVAVYFFATGALWQGGLLAIWGVLVIGLVDNVLRPLLVGKDTRMPDYVVLMSTLGGMSLFGLGGFVLGPTIAALFMAVWSMFICLQQADARRSEADA